MPRRKVISNESAGRKGTKGHTGDEDAELQKALQISLAMQREEEERRAKLEAEVKRKMLKRREPKRTTSSSRGFEKERTRAGSTRSSGKS